jgi:NAD-dependent protein deacetylases, SIR2 family
MTELSTVLELILEKQPQSVAVLTGAGISAESGVPTFRGPGGLWRNYRPEELASPDAFRRDPTLVWEWYDWRRELVRKTEPNAGHLALAELERERPGAVALITQNVDGLHARAGSKSIIELHGNLYRARCTKERKTMALEEPITSIPPHCECGGMLRPDIVWFGESLDSWDMERASNAAASADLLLIVGTSGVVYPAAGLVHVARGKTIEINPDATPITQYCDDSLQMPASRALPAIVNAILGRP